MIILTNSWNIIMLIGGVTNVCERNTIGTALSSQWQKELKKVEKLKSINKIVVSIIKKLDQKYIENSLNP